MDARERERVDIGASQLDPRVCDLLAALDREQEGRGGSTTASERGAVRVEHGDEGAGGPRKPRLLEVPDEVGATGGSGRGRSRRGEAPAGRGSHVATGCRGPADDLRDLTDGVPKDGYDIAHEVRESP
ncbi:MAG: hypothetical protein M0Z33_11855 [Actinomycetota bacterium]|nr:hypothetical protein [Actinomycetota bacterium]